MPEKAIVWKSKRLNEAFDELHPPSKPESLIEDEFVKNYEPARGAKRPIQFGVTPTYRSWWADDETDWGTGQYKVDLSWIEDGSTIVAETQLELNNEALGQALVYGHVYSLRNPAKNVIPAVVCCLAPRHYVEVAKLHGVRIYY